MGKLTVKSRQTTTAFTYENEKTVTTGNYVQDTATGELTSINGNVTLKDTTLFIGSFNGYRRNGEMVFSDSDKPGAHVDTFQEAVSEVMAAATSIADSNGSDDKGEGGEA